MLRMLLIITPHILPRRPGSSRLRRSRARLDMWKANCKPYVNGSKRLRPKPEKNDTPRKRLCPAAAEAEWTDTVRLERLFAPEFHSRYPFTP